MLRTGIIFFLLFCVSLVSSFANAQSGKPKRLMKRGQQVSRESRPLGLGLILMGPTGLSMNYRLGGGKSIDAALAYSTQPGTEIYAHGSYLWRYPNFYRIDNIPFLFFAGLGGRIYTEKKEVNKEKSGRTFVGVRTVAGTSYLLTSTPLEFFLEATLTMDLTPSTSANVGFGLGGRYYF